MSTTTSKTPTPQGKVEKRPSQEESPSIIEVSGKEFEMYTKKEITNPKIDFTKEGSDQAPIVLKTP